MKNRSLRALLCAVILLLPSALLAAGWDFIHPDFNTNNLNGVATVSATEAFAVGDAGTILHYDGDRWQPMLVATHANLTDVWAASATDVFVVGNDILSGDGIVFHYDGTKWEQIFSENGTQLSRVWGSSGTDVFALGYAYESGQPLVFHYNGDGWDVWADPNLVGVFLYQIWGLSSTEVFAVGSDGSAFTYVYQYDGKKWTLMSSYAGEFIPNDIWGSSASDLYMVGTDWSGNGKMLHRDGSDWPPGSEQWEPVVPIDGGWNSALMGMWGISASDIFVVSYLNRDTELAVIYHYDRGRWSEQHNIDNIGFLAIQGSSASDVVAVGSTGGVAHYDGAQWEDVFKSDWYFNLSDVWGVSKSSKSDLFLVGTDPASGSGVILHYDGKDFDLQLSAEHISFGQVWGPSNKDLFATGYDDERQRSVVYHYDGRGWTEQYVLNDNDGLVGLWGTSGTDVFAVGWTKDEAQENTYGKIYHYDGVTWSLQHTLDEPYTFLNSVWGTSGSDVFAVGGYVRHYGEGGVEYRGYIYHYDGFTWGKQNEVVAPQYQTFTDIWGSSASDIFVVGHDNYTGSGTVFHYDGTSWQPQYETPANMGEIFMLSVGGSSASDVYAAGYIRSVAGLFHYDGEAWSLVPDGVFSPVLEGIWAASANDVFVVGTSGTVLHYDGNSLVEPAPDQAGDVTLDKVQTSSVHLSCEELRARYGTPFLFRTVDDLLSLSASILPDDGQIGTFRHRVTGVNAPVRNLTLYSINGEPIPFEYAEAANTFQDGMWWITDENGGYLDIRDVLNKKRSYFVNFAIQDNGLRGYDLSDEPGTIEDTLVLGTDRGCAQKP